MSGEISEMAALVNGVGIGETSPPPTACARTSFPTLPFSDIEPCAIRNYTRLGDRVTGQLGVGDHSRPSSRREEPPTSKSKRHDEHNCCQRDRRGRPDPDNRARTVLESGHGGEFSAAAACASCSKRRSRSGSCEKNAGRTLMATSRFSTESRARYTSPIPPAPRGPRIS